MSPIQSSTAHSSAGATHVLVVTGASGDPEYAARFEGAAATLLTGLGDAGVPAANVTWLAEAPERTRGRAAGRSTKAEVERALAALATRAGAGDRVLVVLIGHGSHQGAESRLNLPGPDITAAELATHLDRIRGASVAVVNAASASGDFVPVLATRGRVVITATKTALERNETRFAAHFARAFAGAAADTDKDGRVSLLEAFDYARREVEREYEQGRRLRTEHAILDDDGDGRGSPTPTATGAGDGRVAAAFVLGGGATRAVAGAGATGARADSLRARRAELERAVADLRARKDSMEPAAYEHELERLALALAGTNQALRALEGGTP
ncbi:MAG TPA: hypothetical protein VFX39_04470 [Gemmatimonadaceae bacterium]|nr:hypothetical protein [Gemmatimonadaceae bacterium]